MGNKHGKLGRKHSKHLPPQDKPTDKKDVRPVDMLKSTRIPPSNYGLDADGEVETKEDLRFRNIYQKPLSVETDYKAPVFSKTKEEVRLIYDAVKENFVFQGLGEKEANILVNAMEPDHVSAGSTIIRQGQAIGDYFYVIKTGEVQCYVDGVSVATLKSGSSFGDLSLLYDCPRTATVIAKSDVDLWKVDRTVFRKVLQSNELTSEQNKMQLLKKVHIFEKLNEFQLKKIADCLNEMGYKAGDKIIEKGTHGQVFYIVKHGTVLLTDIGLGTSEFEGKELGPGQYFGERALITGEVRDANITAKTDDVVLYCMSRDDFHEVLGDLENAIAMNLAVKKLMSVPLIAKLDIEEDEVMRLAQLVEDVSFEKDFVIHSTGDMISPCLYMIRSGRVELTDKSGNFKILTNQDYFGDYTFSKGSDEVKSDHTAKVLENTQCTTLPLSTIKLVVPENKRSSQSTEKVNLKSLQKHRVIGEGTFGQVWLVSHKADNKAYALKIQSKRWLIDKGQDTGVKREKNIMSMLEHPFVIRLVNSFQDEKYLYMVTEIYLGGELYSIMRTTKSSGMSERRAKFYTACILEALDYMHKKHILYRDLKPENVMIDNDGYCVLIDLGFAKVVTSKTYTLCGTPLYIAPEVILQRGHNKAADLWSFAVMVYELIVGKTPFYSRGMDQAQLFRRICSCSFSVDGKCSKNAADMISRMLINPPHVRLGCVVKGADDIRNHVWYTGVKFSYVVSKKFKAPWIPTIKDALDAENFDTLDNLEKHYDDSDKDKPLTPSEQKIFKDF